MLKKSFCLLFAAAACFAATAGELVVAEGGKSPYQIVVPEPTGNKTLDDYVALGGKVIRTAVKKASGAVVTVTLRGRGKAYITAGWVNAAGRFAANSSEVPGILLSEKPQVLSRTFRLTPQIRQKGGDAFYVNIFLSRPGGDFIIERAEVTLRRAK